MPVKHAIDTLTAILAREARRKIGAMLAIVAAGTPLLAVAPLILGTMFWFSSAVLFQHHYPWSWFFWGLLAISTPLLFRLEIRTGGRYMEFAANDIALGPKPPSGMMASPLVSWQFGAAVAAGAALASPRSAAGFVELFLSGPRLILYGVRQMRGMRRLEPVERELAAAIVDALRARDHGFMLDELTEKFGRTEGLARALAYLAAQGWIGISEKQDRVYLYSESREALGG